MYKKEGYWDVKPRIKRLSFPKRGKFQVNLQDGRSVLMPISAFPSLKRMPAKERENWYLMGEGVTWDACSEVIHIEQILGNYQTMFTRRYNYNICITLKTADAYGLRNCGIAIKGYESGLWITENRPQISMASEILFF